MKKTTSYVSLIFLSLFNFSPNITALDSNALEQYKTQVHSDINNLDKLANIFPKTVEEIKHRTEVIIELAKQEIATIKSTENHTFENSMRALDIITHKLGIEASLVHTLVNVHPDQAIRETALESQMTLEKTGIDLLMDPELYDIIQNYYDTSHEVENLSSDSKLLITDYLAACKTSGLHLPDTTLAKVKELKKEISILEQDFIININSDSSYITATAEELEGVNAEFIEQLEKDGDIYIIPALPTTALPIMQECSIEATRKKMFICRFNRAYPENESLLIELLYKRHELAQLLGFENFASLDLSSTSAKTIENLEAFYEPLTKKFLHKNIQEFEELKKELPESISLQEHGTLNQWDYLYIYNEHIKKHFSIDESKIAEYFPIQTVLNGIFTIYQDFLGLTFKQVQPQWSWHEDVILLEIYQTSSNKLLGYLFLDLYPRAHKYSHACVSPALASYNINGSNCTSMATLITNFPKPTADRPSLLPHHDVVTLFHEFGHAMHNILSRTEHPGHAGLSVASDFVETPSQMFEQWMFEPDMMNLVSSHYQTGESLPADIITNLVDVRKSNSGYHMLRQAIVGQFSLYSMTNTSLSYDPAALSKSLFEQYLSTLFKYESKHNWFTSFGHIASDLYASKYYNYLWTEVFAIDLFTEIKKHGFSDEYKQKVIKLLSAGGSIEPEELLEEFLERKPNQEAFLEALGL